MEQSPINGHVFEDTIDGYFPLRESLHQMMVRNGIGFAYICMSHVPIMEISGLAPEAPVPLNINSARPGLIDEMALWVSIQDNSCEICGYGKWHWLSGHDQEESVFDPMIRLAEPAYLTGIVVSPRGMPRQDKNLLQKSA